MQILNDAIVQYEGQWEAGSGTLAGGGLSAKNANDVLAEVSAALSRDGLVVKDSSSNATFLQTHSIPFFGASQEPFTVKLTLQVTNGLGFGSEKDIISIINHEVYQSTGRTPVASSIPIVQNPGAGATPTGQPGVHNTGTGQGKSIFDSISSLFADSQVLIIGIGLGLVVAVLMISSPRRVL